MKGVDKFENKLYLGATIIYIVSKFDGPSYYIHCSY